MIPQLFRITKKNWETSNVFTFSLAPDSHFIFDQILPGQFNMLYAFGVGESPISISRPYDKKLSYEITHTIRSVGDVTQALSRIELGGQVGVRGPFGTPWPLIKAQRKNILIVAGGIALAPLRPVIELLLNNLNSYQSVTIFIGARTPSEIIFIEDILRWKKKVDVHITVDFTQEKNWVHHVGLVTTLLSLYKHDPENTMAMVCGPEIMMKLVSTELIKMKILSENIFLSMERNMKCAIGHCGHCQYGPTFICKDGPVYSYDQIENFLKVREL